jgi:hypothetical protein
MLHLYALKPPFAAGAPIKPRRMSRVPTVLAFGAKSIRSALAIFGQPGPSMLIA